MDVCEILTPAQIQDDVAIIRVTREGWESLDSFSRYELVRGYWSYRKEYCAPAKYALVACHGIIHDVYTIVGWFNAGETYNSKLEPVTEETKNCIEFVGNIAPRSIAQCYLGKSIEGFFAKGDRHPIRVFTTYQSNGQGDCQ